VAGAVGVGVTVTMLVMTVGTQVLMVMVLTTPLGPLAGEVAGELAGEVAGTTDPSAEVVGTSTTDEGVPEATGTAGTAGTELLAKTEEVGIG